MYGNMNKDDALHVSNEIEQILVSGASSSSSSSSTTTTTARLSHDHEPIPARVVSIEPGCHYRVTFEAPRKEEQNSAAYLLFIDGQNELNPKAAATLSLLTQMV
jgi:hypothetical protein